MRTGKQRQERPSRLPMPAKPAKLQYSLATSPPPAPHHTYRTWHKQRGGTCTSRVRIIATYHVNIRQHGKRVPRIVNKRRAKEAREQSRGRRKGRKQVDVDGRCSIISLLNYLHELLEPLYYKAFKSRARLREACHPIPRAIHHKLPPSCCTMLMDI